ncbi:MAG: 2-oxoacid:acceptor oxidoreductase family protein, partial [Clostridia bacterium]|nr:2-oxoacid:acceptor oxidoreductase family protein [Clostridia bacterium]
GAAEYPSGIIESLRSAGADVVAVDALRIALEAGNAKAVNVALIGVMAKSTDIPFDVWIDTIKTTVPPKFLELNLKAFELGYNS